MATMGIFGYTPHGKLQDDGWYVTGSSSGQPEPINSWMSNKFKASGINTLPEIFLYNSVVYDKNNCMGTRQLLFRNKVENIDMPNKKLGLGELKYQTYKDVQESMVCIGQGVKQLGIESGDKVVIFSESRSEWILAAVGCIRECIVVVALLPLFEDNAVIDCINQTKASLLFTSYELLPKIIRYLPKCSSIETVVVMEDQLEGVGDYNKIINDIFFLPFKKLMSPSPKQDTICNIPDSDDVAFIMFTIGSTGHPKGVQITHANILAASQNFVDRGNIYSGDVYLSIHCLAQIQELVTQFGYFFVGATVVYSSINTLMSNSPLIMDGVSGDAMIARPTCLSIFPWVLNRIIDGNEISTEFSLGDYGWIFQYIFSQIMWWKSFIEMIPFSSYMLDYLLFHQIQKELGGRLKYIQIIGSPIKDDLYQRAKSLLSCHIQVCYGLTECTGYVNATSLNESSIDSVGYPGKGVMLRLEDWEERKYLATDKPNPRGEIIVGGFTVAKGYFNISTENNNKVFFIRNGIPCIRTGDVGEIDDAGILRNVDRKENIVKLKTNEYISLRDIELKLKTCKCVENICLFSDYYKGIIVAILVPNYDTFRTAAANVGFSNSTDEELSRNWRMFAKFLNEIRKHGLACGVPRSHLPVALYLTLDTWTTENGLLNITMMPRRKRLRERYQSQIQDLFDKSQ